MLPTVDFPSAMELVLPIPREGFINSLFHPSLALPSDFLGYDQVRPTAPFSYANAWGNNFGMFMPFFIGGCVLAKGRLREPASRCCWSAIIPVTYSLNRGLWGGLILALVLVGLKLAVMGHTRILQVRGRGRLVGGVIFVSSPLYDTVRCEARRAIAMPGDRRWRAPWSTRRRPCHHCSATERPGPCREASRPSPVVRLPNVTNALLRHSVPRALYGD